MAVDDRAGGAARDLGHGYVKVTTLEAAPPNAEHLDLPDGPVYPVPEPLRSLFTQ